MEYHICFYIPKCSYWSVVLKSSVCHHGKPCITPVFKMAYKMAAVPKINPYSKNASYFSCVSIVMVF